MIRAQYCQSPAPWGGGGGALMITSPHAPLKICRQGIHNLQLPTGGQAEPVSCLRSRKDGASHAHLPQIGGRHMRRMFISV